MEWKNSWRSLCNSNPSQLKLLILYSPPPRLTPPLCKTTSFSLFLLYLPFFFFYSRLLLFFFFVLFCFDHSFHSSTFSHVKQLYNLFVVMHDWLQTILTSLWILQRGRGWGVGISFPKFVSGCKLSSNLESCVILCVFLKLEKFLPLFLNSAISTGVAQCSSFIQV